MISLFSALVAFLKEPYTMNFKFLELVFPDQDINEIKTELAKAEGFAIVDSLEGTFSLPGRLLK